MAFSSKRGRPKTVKPLHDCGTPELAFKRALGLTQEPLDGCLQRGLIHPHHHRAGLHLRWLYTLRYGAPSIRVIPLNDEGHSPSRSDNPAWRSDREAEYKEAIALLRQLRAYEPVMRLCVFQDWPASLNAAAPSENQAYQQLITGLTGLCRLWRP